MHIVWWLLFALLLLAGVVSAGGQRVPDGPSPVARAAFWFALAALLVGLVK